MFIDCSGLTTIYVSESFTTSNVTSSNNMFKNCSNLVGGNGTTYNLNYIDKTYACIDVKSAPGYFTLKSSVSSDETENDTTIVSVTSVNDNTLEKINNAETLEPITELPDENEVEELEKVESTNDIETGTIENSEEVKNETIEEVSQ